MNTILLPSEGLAAGVRAAASGSAETVLGYGALASSARAVKLSAAELEHEFVISVETIHTRAETVTSVLESILHRQPVISFNLR